MGAKGAFVPLKRLCDLAAAEEREGFPEHGSDVISTAVLQVARGVDELLRGGGVAAGHLEVGATDDGELLGLAVRDPLRLGQELVGAVKVLVALDLVRLGAAEVDVVRRERAKDARALVLGVGVILLDFWSGIGEGSRGRGSRSDRARGRRSEEAHFASHSRRGAGRARAIVGFDAAQTPARRRRRVGSRARRTRTAPGRHDLAELFLLPALQVRLGQVEPHPQGRELRLQEAEQVVDAVGEIVHLERDRLVRAGDGHVDGQAIDVGVRLHRHLSERRVRGAAPRVAPCGSDFEAASRSKTQTLNFEVGLRENREKASRAP